jgi:hypothetical protein
MNLLGISAFCDGRIDAIVWKIFIGFEIQKKGTIFILD